MTDEQFERLEAKLDTLIKLTALSIGSGDEPVAERAVKLSRAGLAPKDIAAIYNTTPNTISVALSKAKRGKK